MQTVTGSVAQPGHIVVPLCGGTREGKVHPWTMAQRADLRPRLLALLDRVGALDGSDGQLNLGVLFMQAEDELASIARASIVLPEDLTWDELQWADLPNIIQAVWEANFANEEGLMGKLLAMLANALQAVAAKQAKAPPSPAAPPDSAGASPPSQPPLS